MNQKWSLTTYQKLQEKVKSQLIELGCTENINVLILATSHVVQILNKDNFPVFGCEIEIFFKEDIETFELIKKMKVKCSSIEIDGGEAFENCKIQNIAAISKNFEAALEIFYNASLDCENISPASWVI